jgi:carboxyl-terminal processing protease
LKTTIAQFFRISGGSNQHKGVVPDIVFPTAETAHDHGERSLDNALPWEKIEPARYLSASAPVDSFHRAKQQYEVRIKSNKLFQLLLEKQALTQAASNKKSVSLLKDERKNERENCWILNCDCKMNLGSRKVWSLLLKMKKWMKRRKKN